MRPFLPILLFLCVLTGSAYAQVGISGSNMMPDNSAMLDIQSTSRGLLIPRLSMGQIQTITDPVNSLLVFCTTDDKFYAFIATSGQWKELMFGSSLITPSCGTPFTDTRDGRAYRTVQVGSHCWMAQNMNLGTRINGSLGQSNNSIYEKYCYNDLESNCDIYGGLYQWNEMMQYSMTPGVQGICPAGWHLPTDEEYTTLSTLLGGPDEAGGAMKEAGLAHWFSPNTGATNSSGFTALPAGIRNYVGAFGADLGQRGTFWTSTFNEPPTFDCSWNYNLYYNSDGLERNGGAMLVNAFSVRCVKN